MTNWTGAKFGYYLALSCLLLGLTVAAALVAVGIRGHGNVQPQISISAIHAETCPTGERAPACFAIQIKNPGSSAVSIRCKVTPADGTTASFLTTDDMETVRVISAATTSDLQVKVDTAGSDVVNPPRVDCAQI
jgi:hypothetical protein